jgi:hypothetical protein
MLYNVDPKMVINISNEINKGILSPGEIAAKYTVSLQLVNLIMKQKASGSNTKNNTYRSKFTEEQIKSYLEINKEAQTLPIKTVANKYRLAETTVLDIKFCRGAYTDLINFGGIIGTVSASNSSDAKYDENFVENIRSFYKITGLSEPKLAEHFKINRRTIHAILTGTGSYSKYDNIKNK